MLLSAKPINNFCNVNDYTFANQWIVNSGDTLNLYFQIIDVSQAQQNYNTYFSSTLFSGITPIGSTAGTRYLLGIGSSNQPYSVQVTFPSIDNGLQQLTVTATQVDPNDSSIWVVSLAPSMAVGGGNVQFTIYQGNNINRFTVLNMLDVIFPFSNGMC